MIRLPRACVGFIFQLLLPLVALTAINDPTSAAEPPAKPPRVPEGFTIELAASSPLVEHPMMACFDERGRLFIAEAAGKNLERKILDKELPNFIRMIEDTDGDGKFDKSTIFADKLTFPQGVLWHEGSIYCASSGAVWKFTDTNNDGVADVREKIVGDFGYTGNAADVKGPFLGPDGRLYILEGRHGHEVRDKDGKLISKGKAARIFSCKLDGTDFRSFCGGGFDNPVEIVFTDEGDMLGTVNLFHHQPRGDCLVHWVYGGVYPRTDFIDQLKGEFHFTGDLLPEVHNFGHVALSGLCRYRSEHFGLDQTAKGQSPEGADSAPLLPGERSAESARPGEGAASKQVKSLEPTQHTHLFITQFNTHKVIHTTLARSGSTYKALKNEDFLTSDSIDFHPTDVLEDADGSLLIIDTGGWFRIGCPVSQVEKPQMKGAIWRVRKKGGKTFEDARGLHVDWHHADVAKLVALIKDARHSVADSAVNELARRISMNIDRIKVVLHVNTAFPHMAEDADPMMRQRACWLALRCGRLLGHPTAVKKLCTDSNERVRHTMMSCLVELGEWTQGLNYEHEPDLWAHIIERGFKSETIADRRAAGALLDSLAVHQRATPLMPNELVRLSSPLIAAALQALSRRDNDLHAEHAIIHALIELGDAEATSKGLTSDNERVRKGAAIALEQMRRKLTLTDAKSNGIEVPPPHQGTKLTKEELTKLDALEPSLKRGDAATGRKVFESQKASCAICHRVGDKGAEVSLNLTKIGTIRSERDLLESILFPSATFARGFEPFNFTLKDGQIHSGLVSREATDAIHLRGPNNQETKVLRSEIEKIEAGKLSIMPGNYADLLSPQELADLIAYLRSLK